MEKVEQDQHINDIGKEVNIIHKSFKPFGENWIQKNSRFGCHMI